MLTLFFEISWFENPLSRQEGFCGGVLLMYCGFTFVLESPVFGKHLYNLTMKQHGFPIISQYTDIQPA